MRLSKPTRVCKCWVCWSDCGMYSGHGPTADAAILDMEYWRNRHLKGMVEEEKRVNIPKIVNK